MIGQTPDHYRIIETIGAGGMGVVYRAHDKRLDRDVALKVLPAGTLADDVARKRFRQEALALAKLNHPNIETVYEFSSHDGVDFLAMELIPGLPLSGKIAEGPLPLQEIVRLGTQLAEGLSAAHEQGVIHRDLKPRNLFITPDGRLKILDFGLAKLLHPEPASDVTRTDSVQTETVSGTVPYMPPEQLRGLATDARSDIYAAGAVLYEMATGQRPFPQTQSAELIGAILHQTSSPPSSLNPRVSAGLESVINKALEKEPSQRYQTARELRVALEAISAGSSGKAAAPEPVTKKPNSHRYAFAGGGIVLGLLLVAGLMIGLNVSGMRDRLLRRKGADAPANAGMPTPIKTRASVAVLGFENLSARSDEGWLSTALSEMLTTELAAGEQLRTIPGENVAQMKVDLALPDAESYGKETLARIHNNLGTDDVVVGSYLALGDGRIRVDLRLQDAIAGQTLASVTESGSEAEVSELIARAGTKLRVKLGIDPLSIGDAGAVRASLPFSSEAARLYSEGLAKLRLFDALEARNFLGKAVAAEPKYPLAHAALGEAWSLLGYDLKAREEAKTAFDLSSSLSREERLSVEARFHEFSKEWDKAIAGYRALLGLFPDDLEYGLRLARSQIRSGNGKDALETVKVLRTLPSPTSDDPRIDLLEANAWEKRGAYKEALEAGKKTAEKAKALGATRLMIDAMRMQAWELWNLGRPEEAKAANEETRRLYAAAGDRRGVALSSNMLGIILWGYGDFRGAKSAYEQALAIYRQIGDERGIRQVLNGLGILLIYEGDFSRARADLEEAVARARKLGDKFGEEAALGNLAIVALGQGDLAGSRKLNEQLLALARETGTKSFVNNSLSGLGDVLLQAGDLAGAREKYEAAIASRMEAGEKSTTAEGQASLAAVLIEQGDPSAAETLCREAREEFRKEKQSDNELWTDAVLVRALLAQKKAPEAQAEVEASKSLTAKSQFLTARLEMAIATARVAAATGRNAEAKENLRSTFAEAKKKNYPQYQFEAQLALGENEMTSGKTTAGRARLGQLQRDAAAKGFLLIARKANARSQ
jgi:serine/threonine protein kinase/Tfp pilus assembly protein PilF/TolB-like protein